MGGTWRPVPVHRDPVAEGTLTVDGVDATYLLGPSPIGVFIRAIFDPPTFPVGQPSAPYAVRVWETLNEQYDLGLPTLSAAREVRPAR
jgi:hypothetical protein